VRGVEPAESVADHAEGDRKRDPLTRRALQLGDGRPLEELHRDERFAVRLADVVGPNDVRVFEAGDDRRLAQEHPPRGRIVRERRRDSLERDEPPARGTALVSRVDDRHSSGADPATDDVLPHLAGGGSEGGRSGHRRLSMVVCGCEWRKPTWRTAESE